LRILVAEDNAINRQVAVGLLSKMGHRAEIAKDGREAVVRVEREAFDLVLMDMQMPYMDGIAATRAIRALDGAKGAVPIVAMTANAMNGDRERCLAVGMNDYVPKPIDRRRLSALLGRWNERALTGAPVPPPSRQEGAPPLLDAAIQADLNEELGPEGLDSLMASFQDTLSEQLSGIRASLGEHDTEGAVAAVHSLRGAAGNLGIARLARRLADLEAALKAGAEDSEHLLAAVVSAASETTAAIARPAAGE